VQTFREYHDKLNTVVTKIEEQEKAAAKLADEGKKDGPDPSLMGLYNPMAAPMLALPPPGFGGGGMAPAGFGGGMGMGMPPMGMGMGGPMNGYPGGGYGAPY